MPRTATVTVPYMTALMSANSAPSVSELAPGSVTISTPRKPMSERAAAHIAGGLLEPDDRHQGRKQRRGEIDGDGAGKRHQAEGQKQRKLRDRLRQAAREVVARPACCIDRQTGDRQHHRPRSRSMTTANAETAPRRPDISATSHLLAAEAPANSMVAMIIMTMPHGTSSVRPDLLEVGRPGDRCAGNAACFIPVRSSIP